MKTTDNQDELFIVVDTADNFLENRNRFDCHHNVSLIHRAIGVAIFNRHGELLLQKRSMTKDTDPGIYGMSVGGHLTAGDTYESAAKRELMEELGVDVPIQFVNKFEYISAVEHEMDALYRAESDGPFRLNPEETDSVVFVSKTELPKKIRRGEIVLSACAEQGIKILGFL